MSLLTPLAVQNAAVLRAIAASPVALKVADLAALFGRDVENQRKTLKALAAAGLLQAPAFTLTADGEAVLAALARAEQDPPPQAEGAGVPGHAQLVHLQIRPDPLNPRKHFDEAEIAELAESIAQDGLLENLVVRPGEPARVGDVASTISLHRLVAGERRWRAIDFLIRAGRWPEDRPILCKVVDIDDAAHRRIALVENLQRKDLRPIDEAEALKALMAITGKGTAEVAAEIGFTQRFVQQRLQLLELPAPMRDGLNEGETSIEEARRYLAARPRQLTLDPADNLIVMEVAWGQSAQPNNAWTTVRADHSAHDLTADLVKRKLLAVSGPDHAGHALVRLDKPAWDHVMALTGGEGTLVRAKLEAHVRAARIAALGEEMDGRSKAAQIDHLFKAKANITPWLNPPFAIDPEVKARLDARAAQEAKWKAQQERQAKAAAERDAELAAAQREAATRGRQWLADIRAFEDEGLGRDHAAFTASFAELLRRYDVPAPYALALEGEGRNADAVIVDAIGGRGVAMKAALEARRRLICIALNYAAGCDAFSGEDLATPWSTDEEPEDDDPDDDDGDEGVETTNDVAFIDDDEDAEPIGAADEDDDEIPEFLTRLAGGAEARP